MAASTRRRSPVSAASFIVVYRHTVAKEHDWARTLLAPEVDRGVITADELGASVDPRKQRKHFVRSQPDHRRAKHVLEATRDLADEIAAAYAVDTPEVENARGEITRVRG
jgi:protease PrsW